MEQIPWHQKWELDAIQQRIEYAVFGMWPAFPTAEGENPPVWIPTCAWEPSVLNMHLRQSVLKRWASGFPVVFEIVATETYPSPDSVSRIRDMCKSLNISLADFSAMVGLGVIAPETDFEGLELAAKAYITGRRGYPIGKVSAWSTEPLSGTTYFTPPVPPPVGKVPSHAAKAASGSGTGSSQDIVVLPKGGSHVAKATFPPTPAYSGSASSSSGGGGGAGKGAWYGPWWGVDPYPWQPYQSWLPAGRQSFYQKGGKGKKGGKTGGAGPLPPPPPPPPPARR